MFFNFLMMIRKLSKKDIKKYKLNIGYSGIRLLILTILLYLWITFGIFDIYGLVTGILAFSIALPVFFIIYLKRVAE
ncbi:MAG: hypothetical protein SVN78_02655 [Deferribacterota bacterium]|nr:hypothetical protein [Deferribacterota bacterium]